MFSRGEEGVDLQLPALEADLLRKLIREYLQMLEGPPEGPVLERLFPSASLDDEKVEGEFRELTHDSLLTAKRDSAGQVLESLGEEGERRGAVGDAEHEAWLTTLTELRLSIGTQIGADEETMMLEPDPEDPEQWPLAVLHWLGGLQESLVRTLL